ncbi:YjfB family protein [Geothrix terrae]|uniref:YjfB family protein n=1 Tax=Geothrix terrae TaxID=2922720 RepID=UPI0030840646
MPAAVAQNQAKVQTEAATRVFKKALDISAEEGAGLAEMVAQTGGVGQWVHLRA